MLAGGALLCAALVVGAQSQTMPGTVQPRLGEGWTTEDARKREISPRTDRIEATVVKLSVIKDSGRFIVTLDNGTKWTQVESRADARVAVGDSITLTKASIGAYSLITKDGVSTRVKRQR